MLIKLVSVVTNAVVAIKCIPTIIEVRVARHRNNIAINKLKAEYELEYMKKELGIKE